MSRPNYSLITLVSAASLFVMTGCIVQPDHYNASDYNAGTHNSSGTQHSSHHSGAAEWDRGCADAKAGGYDRSGKAGQAYEEGWNACKNGSGQQQNGAQSASDYDRGCADAKTGSYDRSGNAGQAYENGWNACKNAGGQHHQNGAHHASDYDRGCADAKAGSYDRSGKASQAYENGWNACH